MLEFMGTDATLYLDRGRYEVYGERPRKEVPSEEMILGQRNLGRGRDFYDKPDGELIHLTNWIECVRGRKTPSAPVEAGVSAASAAHLANQALQWTGCRLEKLNKREGRGGSKGSNTIYLGCVPEYSRLAATRRSRSWMLPETRFLVHRANKNH